MGVKRRDPTVQPAPAERVQVCKICRFDVATCEHDPLIKDREFLREGCIWCCSWKPQEPPVPPPWPKQPKGADWTSCSKIKKEET
jgi:hypothetical protein